MNIQHIKRNLSNSGRLALAAVLVVGGIYLALYVGFYLMFIGGIADIINIIKAPDTSAWALMWGILKYAFGGLVGVIIGGIMIFLGTRVL